MNIQNNTDEFRFLNSNQDKVKSKSYYVDYIDNSTIPADVKNALSGVLDIVESFGGKVFNVGKILVHKAIELYNKYPNTAQGIFFAIFFGCVISYFPLIGGAIAQIVTPIMVLIGGMRGYFKDKQLLKIQENVMEDIKNDIR